MLTLIIQTRYPGQLIDLRKLRLFGGESPFAISEGVFVISSLMLTLFFAFICSRSKRSHSPVRLYLFAYLLPLTVWILASQIVPMGLFTRLPDDGGGP